MADLVCIFDAVSAKSVVHIKQFFGSMPHSVGDSLKYCLHFGFALGFHHFLLVKWLNVLLACLKVFLFSLDDVVSCMAVLLHS